MIAASSFALITGKKVAGIYDHSAERNLRIAAECQGDVLQGFDGDWSVSFGGTFPELYDGGDNTFVSFEIDGANVKGHDRRSSNSYSAHVTSDLVQVYDYGESAWFAYDVQDPDTAQSYHRKIEEDR